MGDFISLLQRFNFQSSFENFFIPSITFGDSLRTIAEDELLHGLWNQIVQCRIQRTFK